MASVTPTMPPASARHSFSELLAGGNKKIIVAKVIEAIRSRKIFENDGAYGLDRAIVSPFKREQEKISFYMQKQGLLVVIDGENLSTSKVAQPTDLTEKTFIPISIISAIYQIHLMPSEPN